MFLAIYQPLLFMTLCMSYISGGPPRRGDGEGYKQTSMNCHDFSDKCSSIIFKSDAMKCSDMVVVEECIKDLLHYCQRGQQPATGRQNNGTLTTPPSSLQGAMKKNGAPDGRQTQRNATHVHSEHEEDLAVIQENLIRLRNKTCTVPAGLDDTNAATKTTWSSKPSLIGHCCMAFCFIGFHWLTLMLSTTLALQKS